MVRTFQKGVNLCRSEKLIEEAKEAPENDDKEGVEAEEMKNKDSKEPLAKEVVYNWRWFIGKDHHTGVPFWPRKICALLFMNWVILALFNVLVGTTALGVVCGSKIYWGTLALSIPVFIVIAIIMGLILKRKYKKRKANNFQYTPIDLKWSPKRIGVFLITSLVTGILAAMFGLGGGTLNSPAMLELGVLPAQVPATSGLIILLSSSVAIIQYLALGKIQYDYLLWFIFVGFIGGISGHLGIRYYIKKYKKQSTLVILLGCLVLTGMCVLIYTVAILFVSKTAIMTITNPCGK